MGTRSSRRYFGQNWKFCVLLPMPCDVLMFWARLNDWKELPVECVELPCDIDRAEAMPLPPQCQIHQPKPGLAVAKVVKTAIAAKSLDIAFHNRALSMFLIFIESELPPRCSPPYGPISRVLQNPAYFPEISKTVNFARKSAKCRRNWRLGLSRCYNSTVPILPHHSPQLAHFVQQIAFTAVIVSMPNHEEPFRWPR